MEGRGSSAERSSKHKRCRVSGCVELIRVAVERLEETMLKSYATACLMATALAAAPAWAQTNPPAPAGQTPPANIQFVTESRPDMWRASQLEGVDVYNVRNENIGDINEVLIDRQGKVEAIVIGVGGFLGIGDRNVAVPFNALRWEMTNPNTAGAGYGTGGAAGTAAGGTATGAGSPAVTGATGAGTGAAGGTAGTTAAGTTMGAGGQAPAGAAATGTTASGGTAGTASAGNDAAASQNRNVPARAVLAGVTRDQLKQAPEFRSTR